MDVFLNTYISEDGGDVVSYYIPIVFPELVDLYFTSYSLYFLLYASCVMFLVQKTAL